MSGALCLAPEINVLPWLAHRAAAMRCLPFLCSAVGPISSSATVSQRCAPRAHLLPLLHSVALPVADDCSLLFVRCCCRHVADHVQPRVLRSPAVARFDCWSGFRVRQAIVAAVFMAAIRAIQPTRGHHQRNRARLGNRLLQQDQQPPFFLRLYHLIQYAYARHRHQPRMLARSPWPHLHAPACSESGHGVRAPVRAAKYSSFLRQFSSQFSMRFANFSVPFLSRFSFIRVNFHQNFHLFSKNLNVEH